MSQPEEEEKTLVQPGESNIMFGLGEAYWWPPWNEKEWTSSDDTIRGGGSHSTLEIEHHFINPNPNPTVHRPHKTPRVGIFSGVLDHTTLGGAGFASQRTVDEHPGFNLDGYDAIMVDVPASDGKRYTLVLKDDTVLDDDDGPEQSKSTISWEHDFQASQSESKSGSGRFLLRLDEFRPFYRGKPRPDAPPLDKKNIRRVHIMIRSFFGKQQGKFSLSVLSIQAYKYKVSPSSSSSSGCYGSVGPEMMSYEKKPPPQQEKGRRRRRSGAAAAALLRQHQSPPPVIIKDHSYLLATQEENEEEIHNFTRRGLGLFCMLCTCGRFY
ncbi:complex I intermediate-associated protein 30-domain-containing protein [Diplogelasinospora grovesii]|uniref:Complex I intermediate-associated protein 30-domain-containing protein n=1 Tax=Diplogelasinospora grovesii TaxID=303347 RepID=A0AAN6S9L3_9PEZI|nr:complex I intermediate-associated protein 30-domain-containing protein [Diplogelasinospora grovesii]